VSPAELAVALGGAALVEFVELDGMLRAVSVVGGQVRLRPIGPSAEAGDLVDRMLFALRQLVRSGRGGRPGPPALLQDAADRLDRMLLRPLPELGDRPLVVVPTGPLVGAPWSALPSCRGRPVTVSPSATLWHLAATRPPRPPGHAIVAAGPRLTWAEAEACEVARLYRTSPLLPPVSTADAVLDRLDGAALAHFAAHGRLSAENPLFSHLLLADGPLWVYDLDRLHQAPHTVVLASCDSARGMQYAGDEVVGVGTTLLVRGTTQLVAPVVPILDVDTLPVMTELHRRLAAGQPPAVALAALTGVGAVGTGPHAVAASSICVGAGFTPVASIDPRYGADPEPPRRPGALATAAPAAGRGGTGR
jgi:hypothetical protein